MKPRIRIARWGTVLGLAVCGILVSSCERSAVAPQINQPWLAVTAASASLVATGDSVKSSLTVTNSGTTMQTVQFAPCTLLGPLSLRAYAASGTKPAWDSALDDNAPCFTAIEFVSMKPGASHTFLQVNDINEILGDSLPSGSYVLTVSGRYLTPAATTEFSTTPLTLTKHAVAASAFSFTTDKSVYLATALGSGFPTYTFTVIARYTNTGTAPVTLLNACGPHPTWNIWGVGNNVGISEYDPEDLCLIPATPMVVSPGAVRVDTIQFTGPTVSAADGTLFSPLYGQFRITYRAGAGCISSTQPCEIQASNVFAVQLPQ